MKGFIALFILAPCAAFGFAFGLCRMGFRWGDNLAESFIDYLTEDDE